MVIKYKVVKEKEIWEGMVRGTDDLSEQNWVLGEGFTERSFAGIWTHKPGCRLPEKGWKWHDVEEVEYLLQGKMKLLIADQNGKQIASDLLEKGDFFFIGGGVRHAAEIIGNELCIGLLFCPKAYKLPFGQPAWSDFTEDPTGGWSPPKRGSQGENSGDK